MLDYCQKPGNSKAQSVFPLATKFAKKNTFFLKKTKAKKTFTSLTATRFTLRRNTVSIMKISTKFLCLVHPVYATNVAISVVIALFLVVGTAGSLITAIVIGKTKNCHTKANIFIFSLCVSDLISALICSPLWLYRRTWGFEYWKMEEFLCKCNLSVILRKFEC